jgi:hypothetical protein
MMTWTVAMNLLGPGDFLLRMPMKSFSSLAVTVDAMTKLQHFPTKALAGTLLSKPPSTTACAPKAGIGLATLRCGQHQRKTEAGLDNQCWKDSWNSVAYPDGRLAPTPRATCEIQGYVYDAKARCARLLAGPHRDPLLLRHRLPIANHFGPQGVDVVSATQGPQVLAQAVFSLAFEIPAATEYSACPLEVEPLYAFPRTGG